MSGKEKGPSGNSGLSSEVSGSVGKSRSGSTFGAYVNIVCVVAGTGTLGLPFTLNQGGWVVLVLFGIVGLLCLFTSNLLIECLYCRDSERLEEFSDVAKEAFGKFGHYLVKTFQYSITLTVPCIYILLSGLNFHQLLVQLNGSDVLGLKIWILVSGVVVAVPVVFMKTLREVTLLALLGAISTLVVVFCVVIQGGLQFSSAGHVAPPTSLVKWEGLPIALATVSFSYGGNVVYPHIEATMRSPQNWNRAMFFAVVTITLMYLVTGITGYLYYGEDVKSPILDSLPPGAGSITSYILITLHVLLAAPIYLCSFGLEQERWLNIDTLHMSAPRELAIRFALRGTATAILTVVAMYVPYFSDLMGLFGAISSCIIVFLVPITCHYKLFGLRRRPFWHHPCSVAAIAVGLVGLVLGASSAFENLVNHIKEGVTVSNGH